MSGLFIKSKGVDGMYESETFLVENETLDDLLKVVIGEIERNNFAEVGIDNPSYLTSLIGLVEELDSFELTVSVLRYLTKVRGDGEVVFDILEEFLDLLTFFFEKNGLTVNRIKNRCLRLGK